MILQNDDIDISHIEILWNFLGTPVQFCYLFPNLVLQVIKRIYELAWAQFSDLPRGHHKNNSMHKLASKTMIEILPESLIAHVEEKCGSLAATPDFFDVIGQVSWFEDKA